MERPAWHVKVPRQACVGISQYSRAACGYFGAVQRMHRIFNEMYTLCRLHRVLLVRFWGLRGAGWRFCGMVDLISVTMAIPQLPLSLPGQVLPRLLKVLHWGHSCSDSPTSCG